MPAAVKIWFVRVFPFPFRETFLNWLRAFSLQLQISYSCMVTPWVTGRVTIQVTTSLLHSCTCINSRGVPLHLVDSDLGAPTRQPIVALARELGAASRSVTV